MARYKDADALIKTIFPYDVVDKKFYSINAKAVYDAINNAPTADVVPMKEHGQWILCKERLPKEAGEYLVKGTCKGDTKTWKCQFLSLCGIGGWSNDAKNPIVSAWWEPTDVVPREEVAKIFEEIEKTLNRKISRSKLRFEELNSNEKNLSIICMCTL